MGAFSFPPPANCLKSVAVGVTDLDRSVKFYTETWGLVEIHRENRIAYLRAAGQDHHVLALHEQAHPGLVSITFAASDSAQVDILYASLRNGGVAVDGAPADLTTPGGGYGFSFRDPEQRRMQIVAGRADHRERLSDSDRPVKLSHVVLNSADPDAATGFMLERLGFRLSDSTAMMQFLRCNSSHHSVAFAKTGNGTLNHIAFEMASWNALMHGAGRLKEAGHSVQWGVGRHGPGDNVFAYFVDPDGLAIEYTAEVQQIDEASHRPGTPEEWKRPASRLDQWGFADLPTERLKAAMHGDHQLSAQAVDSTKAAS
jgi:catechol 2,3-dioxygenase